MKKFIGIFLSLILIFGFCEAQSGKEIIEGLKKKYASVDDAVVKFEQTVKYGVSKFEQNFSGTFYFKKKNKYRIETEQQTIVTDGVTSWLYSKVNAQVIIDRYREDRNTSSPEKFLLSISDEYIPVILKTERSDNKKVYVLKLTPRDENSSVESAKIWVVEGDFQIIKVEITDISGTVTTYLVKSVKLNSGVDDSIFKFSIPAGVKVVDLR
ncbi:outer membrane lipoprotein carrier protein [Candidatus Thermokryptus mobilis]|uniref:Outer membrane lipoprotein carrier protein n=1 Tax=Candidatus Thermokryptus mobilis TaxID=1643428 RepID=A0A0S4MR51_9BACT|nr:outer membrane lipoprotein carrier protein LolA [Candidatus Thermokryptus mobilis]CUU00987.1 outer membrane lipoprotein carrier protein [Candidatus Thermokryptus mobilis]